MIAINIIAALAFVTYQYVKVPVVQDPGLKLPAKAAQIQRPTIKIMVALDGSINHGGKKITTQELATLCQAHKKKHPNGTLTLEAHKQSRLKNVRVVLNAASKADLTIIVIGTK